MNSKRERIKGIDFARAVCALGIIIYHFYCTPCQSNVRILHHYSTGFWGDVFVVVFFMISGAMLYYNYPKLNIKELGSFYLKRFKSIYSLYWLAFILFYIDQVFERGTPFYNGAPIKLLESVLAIDGYVQYLDQTNYFLVGEWFVGAILILYLLYPLLLWCIKRYFIIVTIIVLGLYIWMLNTNVFLISDRHNILYCLVGFWAGMLWMRFLNKVKDSKLLFFVSMIVVIVLTIAPLPIGRNLSGMCMGIFLFVVLWNIGEILMKNSIIEQWMGEISKLSYAIFLVQHVMIYKVYGVTNPEKIGYSIMLLITTIILVVGCAKILMIINDYCMKCEIFKRNNVNMEKQNE